MKNRSARSTPSRPGRATAVPALALLALALAAPAAAQEREPEMVPLEFVHTLATGPFGGNAPPEVRVGRLPDDVADLIQVPAGARVVGSLIQRGYSTSALAVPGDPPAVRDDWTARLLDAGWTRFQEPSRGGFESNPTDGLQFCMGDSVTLSLGVSRNPAGGSYVHVMHPRSRMYSACQHRQSAMDHGMESLIPSLSPPDGSVARGSSSGGGGDEWEADARIRTDLDVNRLIDHYGAQLRDHGWTPIERTTGERIAVETFRLRGADGGPWHAVLTAAAPANGSERVLAIRITRVVLDLSRRSGSGPRYPVAVVAMDSLDSDEEFEVIRRPDSTPRDVILLQKGATAQALSRAVWTVMIANQVEPTAPAKEQRIRIRAPGSRSEGLAHLPWTDRVVGDLEDAQTREVEGLGMVKALIIYLPHEAEVPPA